MLSDASERMPAPSHWELLQITARRAEILRELADGRTESEIARRMDISNHTVHSHVRELRAVAGVGTSRELARWWRDYRESWLREMSECAGVA